MLGYWNAGMLECWNAGVIRMVGIVGMDEQNFK